VPVKGVVVENQFGSLTVDLTRPDRLFVPSAKSLTATPPLPASFLVDHFKCYRVRGARFRRSGVSVETQFGPMTVDVKRPLRLCAPVDKNGEGVNDPANHLMCYQVRKGTRGPKQVFVTNQFGADSYPVLGPRELCVPSRKTL
jgi:hypothetical protein